MVRQRDMDMQNTDRIAQVNTFRIPPCATSLCMEPHIRLREARRAAGYETAAAAADAMGAGRAAYTHHENGTRRFLQEAERYAKFFRVDLDWLLTGRGEMRGKRPSIPIMGIVAAGSSVIPVTDATGDQELGDIELPERGRIAALTIKGDSMYPRFLDGEHILYDPTPTIPQKLLNCYAVVSTLDGRMMIKMLKASRAVGKFSLWSHNAPEEDVELMACYRIWGMLT